MADPTTDFGYDTSCLNGLNTGRFASGVRLVAEAAYRRLITPRGLLQGGDDEANYGLDLADLIGAVMTPSQIAAIPGQIESELLKDERIETVTATVTSVQTGPGVTLTILVDASTAEGPFSLDLSVSQVTVELLGILPGQ